MFKVPNEHRVRTGAMASDDSYGNNGVFAWNQSANLQIRCIASDGMGWEHVSVSVLLQNGKERCPYWDEMCIVKDMFWSKDACVLQYHPAEADYISMHHYCLHLWRPVGVDFPRPDPIMVGVNIKSQ